MRLVFALALAALVSPALADDAPRKIDFTTPLVVDGVTVIDDVKCPAVVPPGSPPGTPAKPSCTTPVTIGDVIYRALTQRIVQGQPWLESKKWNDIARIVHHAKDYPLTDDQKTTIQTALAGVSSPGLIGAVADLIDPSK